MNKNTLVHQSSESIPRGSIPPMTPQRKQALLVEARKNRVEWVDASSSTYNHTTRRNNNQRTVMEKYLESDRAEGTDGMELLRKSRVPMMTSAVEIVSALYSGIPARQIEERVARQMMSQLSADDVKVVLTGSQRTKESEDEAILLRQSLPLVQKHASGYEVFIQRLRSPEAADVVQGLKLFVSSMETSISTKLQQDQIKKSQIAAEAATSIHAYLDKNIKVLKTHVLWQKDNDDDFQLNCQNAMETFLFQKLHKTLWNLICDTESDTDVEEKIQMLQFISHEHLDIPCGLLSSDAWSVALDALRFVDAQWSPTSKLVLLVEAYRGVTVALCAEELPGADDSLPAIILAILQAKPDQILSNLSFIQTMARPDLLRGELGYVLTCIFSAIQFLMDVKDSSSLTISKEEFNLGLSKCKEENKKKDETREREYSGRQSAENALEDVDRTDSVEDRQSTNFQISPRSVRMARIQGESVNLEWALKFQAESLKGMDSRVNEELSRSPTSEASTMYSLPQGFSRTYSFLGVQPEDIRISDIPTLLHEYNQLVHLCENLLTEKSAELAAEHKRRLKSARDQLESNAAAVDFPMRKSLSSN